MSFQPYAFQNYAFQTVESGAPAAPPEQNSGGFFHERPYKGSYRDQVEKSRKAF